MESWKIDVHGGSSRTLTGEIALSEFENVLVEVSICPGTMKLHPESLRETHFEATVTYSKFPWQIGRKSRMRQLSPGARTLPKRAWGAPRAPFPVQAPGPAGA